LKNSIHIYKVTVQIGILVYADTIQNYILSS